MKSKQQTLEKSQQKLRKEQLQESLKEIIDQIKQTYFEFLSSLKFENITDKQSYKQTMKSRLSFQKQKEQYGGNQPAYDVDRPSYSGYNDMKENSHGASKLSISEIELKTFSFEQELSVQNKGYMAFIRLINNIKQLQDYNHFLRSIVMNADNEGYLEKFQKELLKDLKKLEVEIPSCYFMKKN